MELPIFLLLLFSEAARPIIVSSNLPPNHAPFRRTRFSEVSAKDEAPRSPLSDGNRLGSGRPYREPGDWAKPAPESGIDLGFTPIQTYVAVRRTNTVQRLPRSEAYKEATSPEEVRNAHRLREVLKTKKIQEVYSEEGYEDSAYDHGNSERVTEYDEKYENRKKANSRKSKKYIKKDEDSDDSESQLDETAIMSTRKPKTYRKKAKARKVFHEEPESETGDEGKADGLLSRAYREYRANGDFIDYPHISFEDWTPRPKDIDALSKGHFGKSNQKGDGDLPAIKYIHSLTDAHYGHQPPTPARQPKSIPSHLIGMTKGLEAAPEFTSYAPKKNSHRVKRETSSQYEKELAKALEEHEKVIIGRVLGNIEPPAKEEKDEEHIEISTLKPKPTWIDTFKYPYYHLKNVDPYSPLKYAAHPKLFPKKSGHKMEFYDSRDRMVQCDDIEISLSDVSENSTLPGGKKRITGLGDKIRCMKIKYFGEDPLDSPFFKEGSISPGPTADDLKLSTTKQEDKFVFKVNDSAPQSSQAEINYEVFHPAPTRAGENKTDGRVIPVREFFPEITTAAAIRGMLPPTANALPFLPLSVLSIPRLPKQKPLKQMKKVKSQYNCLQPVTKMIVTERSDEDVMYDCPDVTLIQSIRGDYQHFKIIPKQLKRSRSGIGEANRLLRSGEVLETRFSLSRRKRSDDPNAKRRTQLFPNRSLLDKMMKRSPLLRRQNSTSVSTTASPSTAKPYVASTARPLITPKIERNRAVVPTPSPPRATTRRTITTTPSNKKIMPKKQSGKLSGLDFLTRYHKAKNPTNRNGTSGIEFFKAEDSPDSRSDGYENKRKRGIKDSDVAVVTGMSYVRRSDVLENRKRRSWDPTAKAPVLLYVVNVNTGAGKWISQPTIIPEVMWKSHRYLPILQPKSA